MPRHARPLRELCQELTIYELVRAGLFKWDSSGCCTAKLLGPEVHGLHVLWDWWNETADIRAKMYQDSSGKRIGTLKIAGRFPGYAWVDEVPAKIPPYRHWLFRCQTCDRLCRSLLWCTTGTGGRAGNAIRSDTRTSAGLTRCRRYTQTWPATPLNGWYGTSAGLD